MGSVTGYRLPAAPDTLFVWQVAVHPLARGCGLATRMLDALLARPALSDICHVHTTITPSNSASWALFKAWARRRSAACQVAVMFDRDQHLAGQHDSEMLLAIGPLSKAHPHTPSDL